MKRLENNQLLMLSILMYSDYIKSGDTVQKIVCRIESDLNRGKSVNASRMKPCEWRRLVDIIKNQSDLLLYSVQHLEGNFNSGKNVACFVDNPVNPQDVNIVFRGTHKKDELLDNGMGCYQTDTQKQIEAAEYVNKLPENYGNNMTVTGHSKGGNKAQYVTVTTDRIGRCVPFDSQGFSKAFFEKYADEISKKSHCITAINAADDYVNSIFIPIPCKRIFLKSNINYVYHFIEFHKPNIMLDEYGKLNPVQKRSKFSKQVSKYSAYLLSNRDKFGEDSDIDKLVVIVEKICSVHTKLSRHFFQPLWDFFIVFFGLFVLFPIKMPACFFKGLRLVLSYVGANIKFLRQRRYNLDSSID